VTPNVTYATNIDFLTSKLHASNGAQIQADLMAIGGALTTGNAIPENHYNPFDTTTTKVKVTALKMDIYRPMASVDNSTDRPLILFLHTGNFLPAGINGSPNGNKDDSTAIVLCTEWAKRGYVAAAVNYRLGWNPLATNVEVRRGQLLNAVYRAIHDVKVAVRTMKDSSAIYGIDPNKVTLYGEGTGAYVALAYETLDKNEEMEINSVERYENLIKKMTAQNIFTQKSDDDLVEIQPTDYKNIPVPIKLSPFQDRSYKRNKPTLPVENMHIRKTSSVKSINCKSIEED